MNGRKQIEGGALAGGLVLIALGLIFLLDRITSSDFGDIIRLHWPMILVIVGIGKVFDRETAWSGLWLIALGAWLQITHLRLFGLNYGNSWPLLLIVVGAGMIVRAFLEAATAREQGHER